MVRTLKEIIFFVFISTSMLVGAEFFVRLYEPPGKYLLPNLKPDPKYVVKIEPYEFGSDAWGYRNKAVPNESEIVAIGDSLTWGVSAPSDGSWPAWLEKQTHRTTYNLSLGGYGPVEYKKLLVDRALKLNPKWILIGLNPLSDIQDIDRSEKFFSKPFVEKKDDIEFSFKNVKLFFAMHSQLYRMFMFRAGNFIRTILLKMGSQSGADKVFFDDPQGFRSTGFFPWWRERFTRSDDPKTKDRTNRLNGLILDMKNICKSRDISLGIVLLPSKELVYESYLNKNTVSQFSRIKKIMDDEKLIRDSIASFSKDNDINLIDVLPDLREGLKSIQLYPVKIDDHPNSEGYRVIAKKIADEIEKGGR